MRMRNVVVLIQHITYCAEFSSQVLLDQSLSHISTFRLFGQIQEVLPREVVFLRTCLLRVIISSIIALSIDRQYRFITELRLLISIHIYQTSFHHRRISSTSHSVLGLVLLLLIKNEFSKRLSFNSRTIWRHLAGASSQWSISSGVIESRFINSGQRLLLLWPRLLISLQIVSVALQLQSQSGLLG
jgi:hypothetical protein